MDPMGLYISPHTRARTFFGDVLIRLWNGVNSQIMVEWMCQHLSQSETVSFLFPRTGNWLKPMFHVSFSIDVLHYETKYAGTDHFDTPIISDLSSHQCLFYLARDPLDISCASIETCRGTCIVLYPQLIFTHPRSLYLSFAISVNYA